MSHYLLEIVMPPTDDIEGAVERIMEPFREGGEGDEGDEALPGFWDFYVIGGRFAGSKMESGLDPVKLAEFRQWLIDQKVTVSALQFGKQSLSPASQIAKVDAKWDEMFPRNPPVPCPLFAHSNDQYGRERGTMPDDVMPLGMMPAGYKCSRVIVACPGYSQTSGTWDGPVKAEFMVTNGVWNGVNHMPVAWDETFQGAIEMHRKRLESYADKYRATNEPKADWLVVTVDYHS